MSGGSAVLADRARRHLEDGEAWRAEGKRGEAAGADCRRVMAGGTLGVILSKIHPASVRQRELLTANMSAREALSWMMSGEKCDAERTPQERISSMVSSSGQMKCCGDGYMKR